MRQYTHCFDIATRGQGLYEFTLPLARWVESCRVQTGLLTLFIRHTSASLLIQENADPDVRHDLEAFLSRLVPEGDPIYRHRLEGPDDMPAHVRSALTHTHLAIPVLEGRLALGTWQGVYLFEHRRAAQRREVLAHLLAD
ncbi:MAG: secondary thiamine-phosphate synthase enzyme YjbQ [Thiobacillaceae bacterium]|nr:secondary thiamine-phosphate synthase enzyme YjbQ [Thiobacillaceae bacterium]MCX7673258.1 secondary thiamine-phosphate synthase enzyme YjbQ [Thiobacillaceae bacterium]MDW8323993.1 secondary thiamine-phosphate synthase enzyme YjbQ [Burkholderiales bacterium]